MGMIFMAWICACRGVSTVQGSVNVGILRDLHNSFISGLIVGIVIAAASTTL